MIVDRLVNVFKNCNKIVQQNWIIFLIANYVHYYGKWVFMILWEMGVLTFISLCMRLKELDIQKVSVFE